jgi:hypothetical protein
MSSRRQFIFDCSAVIAALAVAPMSALGRPARACDGVQSLEQMSCSALAEQVNTIFQVRVSSREVVALTLLKARLARSTLVKLGRSSPREAGYEKFSLIFSGPKTTLLASAIHQFEHGQLGRFEMYVGQIGTHDAETVRYEAGFNRPAPALSAAARLT